MGLKQHIVIVNEYTVKGKTGKGSRGSTPGEYVRRYMSRKGATEEVTPIRNLDIEPFITRYMARKEATEMLYDTLKTKDEMKKAQGLGGVAFGYGSVSLSHEKLKQCSRDIQQQFDKGKTVLKTVLSFDEEYLKENNIVPKDFKLKEAGDYRGNIDQMKLRMAIMSGLERMGRDYDDLKYIGVIQVDSKHVHCHLAMVDRGVGNVTENGTQRGKIYEKSKKTLRRGIDMFLDESKQIPMLSSMVTYEKRNVLCHLKKRTHKILEEYGSPQFLLQCLPKQKNKWRASSKAKDMRKPNTIVREYVMDFLHEKNSGYTNVLHKIDAYAAERQQREGLTPKEHRRIIDEAKNDFVTKCMDNVYGVLKQIPDEEFTISTPMLSIMAMDYEELHANRHVDDLLEFGFKLRTFSSRLQRHKKETGKWHDLKTEYEQSTSVSPDSKSLYDFFKFEEEYNAQLMSKYNHLLFFIPPKDEYEDDYEELMAYQRKMSNLRLMKEDKNMARMTSDNAEEYGRKTYDMHGGRYTVIDKKVLDVRLLSMQNTYDKMCEDFKYKIAEYGLSFDGEGVKKESPYDFEKVKGLDLHHLAYDWTYDVEVPVPIVDTFIAQADMRYELCEGAKNYLMKSGQELMVDILPVKDVEAMKTLADSMRQSPILKNNLSDAVLSKAHKTIPLEVDYNTVMKNAIKTTVDTQLLIE